MKRRFLAGMLLMSMILALTGCGGEVVVTVPPVTQDISSSVALDGYVVENPTTLALTSVQNSATVFAGIDAATGAEYRAFLGFPLTSIPLNALIDSAFLDIVVRDIQPRTGSIPLRVELVSFSAPLIPNDFDRILLPPLAFVTTTIPLAAVGSSALVDVTAFMREAQRSGFANFQVRILLDLGLVADQLIEIDDTAQFAPLLTVSYF